MAGTATISDVADHANVSVATVDRVLHMREGVSEKTRGQVIDAIHELGFGQLPAGLMHRTRANLKFLFLLPKLETGFVAAIEKSILDTRSPASDIKISIEIRRVALTTGSEIIAELQNLRASEFDGIGLFAFDAPGVCAAIDQVRNNGISVVTLVSDVPSSTRNGYIGVDNIAAGRTAGRLVGKFLRGESGEVGIVTGNMNIRDHMERLLGFRQIIDADYPDLKLLAPQEGESVAETNRAIVARLLSEYPNLSGIYSIGGGNSGVIETLKKITTRRRPVTVLHERTKSSREALNDNVIDAIVSQNTDQIARGSIATLVSSSLGEKVDQSLTKVSIDIYLAENLL